MFLTTGKSFSVDRTDTKRLSDVSFKDDLEEDYDFSVCLGKKLVVFHLKDDKRRLFSVTLYYENHIIDSQEIVYYVKSPHESFLSSECLCMEFSDPIVCTNKILYVNDNMDAFKIYSLNEKGLGGMYANKDFIYYAMEFEDNSIFKVNVNSDECFNYKGYFPDANIYETVNRGIKTIVFNSSFEGNAYMNRCKTFMLSDCTVESCEIQIDSFSKEHIQIP